MNTPIASMDMTNAAPERTSIDPDVLDRVNAALEEIRQGKMVILVDDEDRENEGDLTLAADKVTPEAINFMAKYGRGLICLALDEDMVERLDLPMMRAPGRAGPPLGTAFTVSIEAARGVTTGISAADRAHTIKVAVDPKVQPQDVVTPGHVFPLKARPGGVLVRTGQTEGAVDLARLAGFSGSGVICEIMKDDGTMARMPDLEVFAEEHDLRILTVADLIEYRLQTERLVRRLEEREVTLQTGSTWRGVVYEAVVEQRQALCLVKGELDPDEPVLCRVHSGTTLADVFGGGTGQGRDALDRAIAQIEEAGKGVLLYLASPRSLADELERIGGAVPRPKDSIAVAAANASDEKPSENMLRRLGLGAQILVDVGARKLRLLTNSTRRVVGIKGYGLEIVERVPLDGSATKEATKE